MGGASPREALLDSKRIKRKGRNKGKGRDQSREGKKDRESNTSMGKHISVRGCQEHQTETRDRPSYVSVRDLEKLWVQSKTLQLNQLLDYVHETYWFPEGIVVGFVCLFVCLFLLFVLWRPTSQLPNKYKETYSYL